MSIDKQVKAVAHPVRWQILQWLKQKPLSCGSLAQLAKVSNATMTQHLAVLRQAGLVMAQKQGVTVWVRRDEIALVKLKQQLQDL